MTYNNSIYSLFLLPINLANTLLVFFSFSYKTDTKNTNGFHCSVTNNLVSEPAHLEFFCKFILTKKVVFLNQLSEMGAKLT